MIIRLSVLSFLLFFAAIPFARSADSGDERYREDVTRPVRNAVKIRQDTQKQEEEWREEKRKLAARFEQLQAEQETLGDRRLHLKESNLAANRRVAEKEKQLEDIEQIRTRIEPFLANMLDLLRGLMDDDPPFLPEEREKRLERLEEILNDPETAVSEKYRKAMEALLVEAEYGNTIEVYQQTVEVDGDTMLANIFRLGRISLFYQSLDRSVCGFYNMAENDWRPLPVKYNRDIGAAIEMGAKRRPVELLSLPLGRLSIR